MIGDSNQLYDGYGFMTGVEKCLGNKFGSYATPIMPTGGAWSGSFASYTATGMDNSGLVLSSGADASVSKFTPFNYGHIESGTTTGSGGIGIVGGSSFRNQDEINVYFSYLAADSYSGGKFRPGARLGVAPYDQIAVGGSDVSTTGGVDYFATEKLTIPADAGRVGKTIEARFSIPGYTVTGPFTGLWARAENASLQSGISCHLLYGEGGQSAWDMAHKISNHNDAALTRFFAEVRRLQISVGQSPIVVMYLNGGLNDRNEANKPSLGPASSLSPTSPEAYVDNIRAIQARIYSIWRTAGWDFAELYWFFCPSHRIADPDDAQLVAYRSELAAATAGDANTSVVDLGARMTYAAANSAGWYKSGESQMHLTSLGYDEIAELMFSDVL